MRRIVIDVTAFRTRAAVFEEDALTQLWYDFPGRRMPRRGDVYRAKVTSIDKRMNAAFCDLGGGQSGFLRRQGKLPPEGSRLLVTVRREGYTGKGPEVTDAVIWRHPLVSLRSGGEPRETAFAIGDDAFAAAASELQEEIDCQTEDGPLGPVRAGNGASAAIRALLAVGDDGADEIIVTDPASRAALDKALGGAVPVLLEEPFAVRAAMDEGEEDALARDVPLPGGGRLVIDQTEALTSIDLDLGRQDGQSQKGAGARLLQDALGVLRQYAQLAQLGGQIVVDVPRGAVAAPKILRDQMARCFRPLGRVSVPAVTPEGICVVIAPRPGPSLLEQLTVPADSRVMVRAGLVLAPDALAAQAYEALEQALAADRTARVTLCLSPSIAACAPHRADGNEAYQPLVERYGARFDVRQDEVCPEWEGYRVA